MLIAFLIFLIAQGFLGAENVADSLKIKNWHAWIRTDLKEAGSSFAVKDNVLSVKVVNPASPKHTHYIQIKNNKVQLAENKFYKFSFDIDSSKSGGIELVYVKDSKPWTKYFHKSLNIIKGKNSYSVSITPESGVNDYAKKNTLDFRVGSMDGAELTITNMFLVSVKPPELFKTYYRPKVYNNINKKAVAAEIDKVLKLYYKKLPEIKSLQSAFKKEANILSDALAKRAEITARLVSYIEKLLKSTESDALLFARQGKNELCDLLGYFDEMKQRYYFLKTNPPVKVFSIKDFGAVGDGVHNDAPAFAKALDTARKIQGLKKIVVPKGTYLFGQKFIPKKTFTADKDGWKIAMPFYLKSRADELNGQHIPFQRNLSNLTIEGKDGVLLLGSDPGVGFFYFYKANNLTVRNLTFDYENFPNTQGVIENVDIKNKCITLKIDKGFPDPDYDYFLSTASFLAMTYNPEDGRIVPEASDKWVDAVKSLDSKHFMIRFKRSNAKTLMAGLKLGLKMVIMARNNKMYSCLAGNIDCRHLLYDNLTVYCAPGTVFGGSRSYASSVINCKIQAPKERNMLQSTNSDPCMISGAIIGPYVANNHFERAGDDFANNCVGGTQINDASKDGKTLFANAGIWKAGKMVSVIDRSDGTVKAESLVESTKQLPGWKAMISLKSPVTNVVTRKVLNKKALSEKEKYELVMNSIVHNDQKGRKHPDLLINRVSHASGTIISGNTFLHSRAGGIFCKVSNAIIENNTLDGIKTSAVLINMYAQHYTECHAPHTIVVRNNKFINNGRGITTSYSLYSGLSKDLTPIRDIYIENNLLDNAMGNSFYNCWDVKINGNKFLSMCSFSINCARNITITANEFALPAKQAIKVGPITRNIVIKDNHYQKPIKTRKKGE